MDPLAAAPGPRCYACLRPGLPENGKVVQFHKRCFEILLRSLLPSPSSDLPVSNLFEQHIVISGQNANELRNRLATRITAIENPEDRASLTNMQRVLEGFRDVNNSCWVLKKGVLYCTFKDFVQDSINEIDEIPSSDRYDDSGGH